MTLLQYCRNYLAQRPDLSPGYCRRLNATAKMLCRWARRAVALREVDRMMLADWARDLLHTGQRPATVNTKVKHVRSLLLAAYDDGAIRRPPRRFRRLKENLPPPEAWTVGEISRLLGYLGRVPGKVGHWPAGDWWQALCLTVYWTGCRIGALMRVPVEDYSPGEGLIARRQKNGRQQWYPLPASCCAAIERVLPPDGPLFRWPRHSRTLWIHFRDYVEAAGLPCPRTHNQLFHRLRRTNASYCAAVDPAIAQRQLDHADPRTTRASYIDPRIARGLSAADVLPDPMPGGTPTLRIFG